MALLFPCLALSGAKILEKNRLSIREGSPFTFEIFLTSAPDRGSIPTSYATRATGCFKRISNIRPLLCKFCIRFVKCDQRIGVCFVGLNYRDSYMRRIGELRVGIASQISKAS